jgi:predicted O-linked N-acetylglucosamine transferase (SPINDLY family)
MALARLGETQEALTSFDRAIACDPQSAAAHGNRGDVLAQLGRLPEAVDSYRHALEVEPDSVPTWCNLGAAQVELGDVLEALASYDRVVALDPMFAEAHVNRGNILLLLGREQDAAQAYDAALRLRPDYLEAREARSAALLRQAAAYIALGQKQDALACFDEAIAGDPSNADALSNRGLLLHSLNRFDEALGSLDRALMVEPNHSNAHNNRGVVLSDTGRHAQALASYDRALAISPQDAGALCNRAKALLGLCREGEALASAERAITVDPEHVEAHYMRGFLLSRQHRYDEALAEFEHVLERKPEHPHAVAQAASCCLWMCDWERLPTLKERLCAGMKAGRAVVSPHLLLQLSAGPADTLAGTRRFMATECPPGSPLDALPSRPPGDRIRIVYLSGDFRVHPVGYLIADLLERHDRRRFETIGISLGPDDNSLLRARIARSFDQFHDARSAGDRGIAALIRSLGVDIAIDLGGHTDNARPGVLQYRPAPVQAQYLGYAGTMGADFIDYIIADPIALPFDQQPHYVEKIVHLPDCFLVNDSTKAISEHTLSRSEAGLPDQGFVFCCFNNSYKVTAETFAVWMRLVKQVEGSVLWLSQPNPSAAANLRRAAAAAGVDPGRIVFAPRMPSMADHFARHRLADLFLDTPGYNAHTTASDALWAGLPVLTSLGPTFAGRVAASLLHAIGLPKLVTTTIEDYERLALELAADPERLSALRGKLARNRLTMPLFDTDRFRRHIEAAYATMWRIRQQGEPPRSFSVAPEL